MDGKKAEEALCRFQKEACIYEEKDCGSNPGGDTYDQQPDSRCSSIFSLE